MPIFSAKSKKILSECHEDLQRLFNEVIKQYDCAVTWGYRGEADQNAAFARGDSDLKFPHSRHNHNPSLAADVVPYPSLYSDSKLCYEFGLKVLAIAKDLGIKIRWGGDWNGDGVHTKNENDLAHFELKS